MCRGLAREGDATPADAKTRSHARHSGKSCALKAAREDCALSNASDRHHLLCFFLAPWQRFKSEDKHWKSTSHYPSYGSITYQLLSCIVRDESSSLYFVSNSCNPIPFLMRHGWHHATMCHPP